MPRSRGRQHWNRYGLVYRITCKQNGKVYIGKTSHTYPTARWRSHIQQVRIGHADKLHSAMREHGIDAFEWAPVASALTWNMLDELERILIEQYRSNVDGYNSTQGNSPKPPKAPEPEPLPTPEYEARQRALDAQEDLMYELEELDRIEDAMARK